VLTKGALDRPVTTPDLSANSFGTGRELFSMFRNNVSPSTEGASILF
jgi:phosphogluconate dehydratase